MHSKYLTNRFGSAQKAGGGTPPQEAARGRGAGPGRAVLRDLAWPRPLQPRLASGGARRRVAPLLSCADSLYGSGCRTWAAGQAPGRPVGPVRAVAVAAALELRLAEMQSLLRSRVVTATWLPRLGRCAGAWAAAGRGACAAAPTAALRCTECERVCAWHV